MASETQTESQVIELATESFKASCDDIAGMFGVGMECEQQEVRAETVAGLKKCFKKLVAVNVVESTGTLEGTFQLIFDQEGLFTLGGVIVMLPEQKILANRKDPSPQLATSMVDAVGEAGNLLVGSWDRVFREGITRHGHFLQKLPAFIGKPWDDPQSKIGLAADEEFIYIPYEMTIGSYPSFNCGVIFPKSIFAGHSEAPSKPDSEPAAGTSDGPVSEAAPEAQTPQDVQTIPVKAGSKESDSPDKSDTPQNSVSKESGQKSPAAEEAPAGKEAAVQEKPTEIAAAVPAPVETSQGGEDTAGDKTETEQPAAAEENTSKKSKSKRHAAKTSDKEAEVKKDTPDTPAEEAAEAQAQADPPVGQEAAPLQEHQEPATGKVSEAIQKMTQSYAVLPGEPDRPTLSESETPAPACVTVKDKNGVHQVTDRRRKNTGLNRFLSICAKDVMQGPVIWANPDETVQQALAKMQQHDTGYLMVGADGVLEGIVSRSDITGALSPYLRSIFAKWRRPLDDATLKIKIKWIMSRPVRTVKPQTPLVTIMENVCRFGGSGLPVVDEQGKVQGMVTVFNIFQTMLNTCADVSTVGRAPQTPPLA